MCNNDVVMVPGSASSVEGLNDTTSHSSYLPSTSSAFDMHGMMASEAIIVLPRSELDRANKDKRHYPEDFQVTAINRIVTIYILSTL